MFVTIAGFTARGPAGSWVKPFYPYDARGASCSPQHNWAAPTGGRSSSCSILSAGWSGMWWHGYRWRVRFRLNSRLFVSRVLCVSTVLLTKESFLFGSAHMKSLVASVKKIRFLCVGGTWCRKMDTRWTPPRSLYFSLNSCWGCAIKAAGWWIFVAAQEAGSLLDWGWGSMSSALTT